MCYYLKVYLGSSICFVFFIGWLFNFSCILMDLILLIMFIFGMYGFFSYFVSEFLMYGMVDEKIDVFVFGVLLLEFISGRRVLDYL